MSDWTNSETVETVSDARVEVSVLLGVDEIPERVSVRGSTTSQGSHQAVEEALARLGWRVDAGRSLSMASWEAGEGEGEEVCLLPRNYVEKI